VDMDEVLVEAQVGFVEGLRNYSRSRGKFLAWAGTCIRNSVIDSVRWQAMSPSARVREWAITRATEELAAKLGREPTDEELEEVVGKVPVGLSINRCANLPLTGVYHYEGPESDPQVCLENSLAARALADRLNRLSLVPRTAIVMYGCGYTKEDIARRLGINAQKVAKIIRSARAFLEPVREELEGAVSWA
jgi:RNA polymerase sigma factor (sigma-70 family)